jgi:hypothetical protein
VRHDFGYSGIAPFQSFVDFANRIQAVGLVFHSVGPSGIKSFCETWFQGLKSLTYIRVPSGKDASLRV